jgi:hypothetical protein
VIVPVRSHVGALPALGWEFLSGATKTHKDTDNFLVYGRRIINTLRPNEA